MKTKTRRSHKKAWIIVIVIIILVLLGAAGAYAYDRFFMTSKNTSTTSSKASQAAQPSGIVNYSPATTDQQSAGTTTKAQAQSQSSSTTQSSGLNVAIQGTQPKLTVIISNAISSGTCTLKLTGPSTQTLTSSVQPESSYAVCESFDTSTLAGGTWTATVSVQSGSQTGSASQTFTVE